jgi:hypothetical protein
MKQERGTKQRFVQFPLLSIYLLLIDPRRKTTYYIAQGRAVCCMVVLYTSLEDIVAENDHRYEELPASSNIEYVVFFNL